MGNDAGQQATGFQDVSSLPLGNLLQIKQQGRAKAKKGLVKKLMKKGFK